ncbi:SET domain-containing protein [Sistotremastrum niveocremeum HHB9708]|uniref:SET domain-containing protein n=1 Tax=Sistotremastrum niveocremeum HHB9708 TaxID=1314777 RepID=A0A164YQ98_9AGAM|nr:SET domain-containing protein [Sistotremastrum niveocremeum HHB9708]
MSFTSLKQVRNQRRLKSYVDSQPLSATEILNSSIEIATVTASSSSTSALKIDWAQDDLPISVEVRQSSHDGRGIWAKQKIKRGTPVISLKPYVSVLSTPNLASYCSKCFSPNEEGKSLKRCSKCRVLHYCSAACQNADWDVHKPECSSIQRWTAEAPNAAVAVPGEAIRCIGRLLWDLQKKGSDHLHSKAIRSMESHRTSLSTSSASSQTHIAHSIVKYLRVSSPLELSEYGIGSAAELVDFISRFTVNTFTLTTPSLSSIGISISPVAALINHSCEPNAVIVFPRSSQSAQMDEPVLKVVTLRDLDPNEEILTSYIDTVLPRDQRQALLKETYHFTCQCSLCTRDYSATPDPRASIFCPKKCGGMCPIPSDDVKITRCLKCGQQLSEKSAGVVLDAVRLGQEALDKASSLETTDPMAALRLVTNIQTTFAQANLTPSTHPSLSLTRLRCSLMITLLSTNPQISLNETIRLSGICVSALRDLYPEGHPVRAIAIAELGKLLTVDESSESTPAVAETPLNTFPPSGVKRLRLAHETLTKAYAELEIGFGPGGGLIGLETLKLAREIDQEINVWTRGVRNVLENR